MDRQTVSTADYEKLKRAFQAAKKYIDESPCDPDIYPEQLEAWLEYQDALKELS